MKSPVSMVSPWFYSEVTAQAGVSVPLDPDHEERAIYLVDGEVEDAHAEGRDDDGAVEEDRVRLDRVEKLVVGEGGVGKAELGEGRALFAEERAEGFAGGGGQTAR